ncbi:MAG: hypothetical protein AAB975_01495, partial [Patescibacteria group bacterium]
MDFGVAYFDLGKVVSAKGGDTVQMYLGAEKDILLNDHHALIPYVRTEIYVPVGAWQGDAHAGAHIFAGVVKD